MFKIIHNNLLPFIKQNNIKLLFPDDAKYGKFSTITHPIITDIANLFYEDNIPKNKYLKYLFNINVLCLLISHRGVIKKKNRIIIKKKALTINTRKFKLEDIQRLCNFIFNTFDIKFSPEVIKETNSTQIFMTLQDFENFYEKYSDKLTSTFKNKYKNSLRK
jgi:hypothetical protein